MACLIAVLPAMSQGGSMIAASKPIAMTAAVAAVLLLSCLHAPARADTIFDVTAGLVSGTLTIDTNAGLIAAMDLHLDGGPTNFTVINTSVLWPFAPPHTWFLSGPN